MPTGLRASRSSAVPIQGITGRSRYRKRPSAAVGDTSRHLKTLRGALKAYRKGQSQPERLGALSPFRKLCGQGGHLRHALSHEGIPVSMADTLLELVQELSAEEVLNGPVDHGFDHCHEGPGRMPSRVEVTRGPAIDRLQAALLELRDHVQWLETRRAL